VESTGASKTANDIDYCLVENQNLFGASIHIWSSIFGANTMHCLCIVIIPYQQEQMGPKKQAAI
jgi:hypothetical protein